MLTNFVQLILDWNLLEVPQAYSESKQGLIDYIFRKIELWDDFSLSEGRTKILQNFKELDDEKDAFLRTLNANNIDYR